MWLHVCFHCTCGLYLHIEIWLYVYQFLITVHLSLHIYSCWSRLRQATCAVTCGDIGLLSVQLAVFVMLHAADIDTVFLSPRLSQWACSWNCSENSKEVDQRASWWGRTCEDNPCLKQTALNLKAMHFVQYCLICAFVDFGWVETRNTDFHASLYQTYYPPASLDQPFSLRSACTSN